MSHIVVIKSVFNKEDQRIYNTDRETIFEALLDHFPNGLNGEYDEIRVQKNGVEVNVRDFDTKIEEGDIIVAAAITGGASFFILLVINLLISAATYFLLQQNQKSQKLPAEGTPVYSVRQSQMQIKENGVISEIFGKFKVYPALICNPLTVYHNNEEYTFLTFCFGKGSYDLNNVYLNDNSVAKLLGTNASECSDAVSSAEDCISKIDPAQFMITKFNPGEVGTAGVMNNLVNSRFLKYTDQLQIKEIITGTYYDALTGIFTKTYATNSINFNYNYLFCTPDTYKDYDLAGTLDKGVWGDYTQLFKYNDTNTGDIFISVDVPGGLYSIDSDGNSHNYTVSFSFEVSVIDNDLGIHVPVKSGDIVLTANSKQHIRQTFTVGALNSGKQYYIRLKSNTTRNTGSTNNISDNYTIKSIIAYIEETNVDFGDVTLGTIRLKPGKSFNNNNSLKISTLVSRKGISTLEDAIDYVWNTDRDTVKQIEDIDTLSDYSCDCEIASTMSAYDAVHELLAARNRYMIATMNGFSVKEDTFKYLVSYVFDKSNIKHGSMTRSCSFASSLSNDGFTVSYYDQDYNKQETTYPFNAANPESTFIMGVLQPGSIEDYARIRYNRQVYESETIQFETELEGLIVYVGSLIEVAFNDLAENDTYVSEVAAVNATEFILDNEVYLSADYTNGCVIRSELTALEDEYEIVYSGAGEWTNRITVNGLDPTAFENYATAIIVGEQTSITRKYTVKKVETSGTGDSQYVMKITAARYDDRMYTDILY